MLRQEAGENNRLQGAWGRDFPSARLIFAEKRPTTMDPYKNLTFQWGGSRISPMQEVKVIVKSLMPLVKKAVADSSIGFRPQGYGQKPHAVWEAGGGERVEFGS